MNNFSLVQLRKRCRMSIPSYYGEGDVVNTADGIYIHSKRGGKVLAVAHLDTVLDNPHFAWQEFADPDGSVSEILVVNARLDDRLGAYLILDYLPDILKDRDLPPYDVLLTVGEESGNSTAKHFKTDTRYNWVFSFDRAGADVVMYKYDSVAWRAIAEKYGFMVARGSYSDIQSLDLGCKGINVGCGYQDNHGPGAFAFVSDTLYMAERFVNMYASEVDVRHAHKDAPPPVAAKTWLIGSPQGYEWCYGEAYAGLWGELSPWELTEDELRQVKMTRRIPDGVIASRLALSRRK